MIAYRLLESLSHTCIKQVTQIQIKVHHYEFQIKGSKILNQRLASHQRILSDNENSDNKNEVLTELPEFKIGDELKISKTELLEKQHSLPNFIQRLTSYQRWKMQADLLKIKKNRKHSPILASEPQPPEHPLLKPCSAETILSGKAKPFIPLIKACRFTTLSKTKNSQCPNDRRMGNSTG
jgi:DNA topoisomerase-3